MSFPLRVLVLVGALASANVLAAVGYRARVARTFKPRFDVPMKLGEWTSDDPDGGWTEASGIGADWMLHRTYVDAHGDDVELLLVFDAPGRHSHYSPETCLQNAGWEFLDKRATQVRCEKSLSAERIPVTEGVVCKEGRTRVVLYWYQLGGKCFSGRVARQIALIEEALRPNPRQTGLNVRITAEAASGTPRQSAVLARNFLCRVVAHLPTGRR